MSDEAVALLRAGALFGHDVTVPSGEPVDDVHARLYRHGALAGRAVVRLTAEALAPGEDLEMEFLGFAEPEPLGKVAKRRRRALGFPGWALVNDPDNARFALEVVKEFKKQARRAKSKPGHAKEGLDGIGERLGRAVPHFLPSFYEEAGRAFIEVGNLGYAATSFGKAREAEKVHALPVDESLRREAFLEFALAGALTNKALTEYARELETSRSPEVAYEHFRELCVKRTLGGMPPWGGMGKELKRLAKVSARDPAEEQAAFIAEVIDSPSLARASKDFWEVYREPIVELAKTSAKIRAVLLGLLPTPPGDDRGFDDQWLALLEEAGALDALWRAPSDGRDEADAQPPGGPAAWIGRLVAHSARGWRARTMPDRMFALLRRVAARLVADGEPVHLEAGRRRQIDLDLADLALELGIPIAMPPELAMVDLGVWALGEGRERPRDPVHFAADDRLSPLLHRALDDVMGKEPFETVSRGKKGLAAAKSRWLTHWVAAITSGGLPRAEQALTRLAAAASAHTFAELPEAYERMKAAAIALPLQRTLAGGILDELGFAALDDAAADLSKHAVTVTVRGVFPYPIVTAGARAIVVGPEGRIFEHEIVLPKGATLSGLRYAGGQLLVVFRQPPNKSQAYWSARPSEIFDVESIWTLDQPGGYAVVREDGSVTEGGRALKAGDAATPEIAPMLCDKSTYWRIAWNGQAHGAEEYDPRTGELGRWSLPDFIESFATEGLKLSIPECTLCPVPSSLASSPLGTRDGLVGWRVRRRDPGAQTARDAPAAECEGIDGRRFVGLCGGDDGAGGQVPCGLLAIPGDERPRPVVIESAGWWGRPGQYAIFEPGGAFASVTVGHGHEAYGEGSPFVLAPHYWHLYSPRDEEGSRALRAVTVDLAERLLAAAGEDRAGISVGQRAPLDKTRDAVAALAPGVTHPRLRDGVAGVVREAALLSATLASLVETRNPALAHASARSAGMENVQEDLAARALSGLLARAWGAPVSLSAQIVEVSNACRTRALPATPEKPTTLAWEDLVGRIGAVAFCAAAIGTSGEARATLLALLDVWRSTALVEDVDRFRVLTISIDASKLPLPATPTGHGRQGVFEQGGSLYFAREQGWYGGSSHTPRVPLLEHAAAPGAFRLPTSADLVSERRCSVGWGTKERIGRFIELLRERGPVPWDGAIAAEIQRRAGLSRGEAALLWAGLPNADNYRATFLPKELRETLGLKSDEARVARDALRSLSLDVRLALFESAMPDEPEALWTPLEGGDASPVARFADAYTRLVGKRVAVPDELLLAADKEVSATLNAAAMLSMLADPARAPELNRDVEWILHPNGNVVRSQESGADASDGFGAATLTSLVVYVPYLFVELPVGHPIRSNLPDAVGRARTRLTSPMLVLPIGSRYFYGGGGDGAAERAALVDALGGEQASDDGSRRDAGHLLGVFSEHTAALAFRPAQIAGHEELVTSLARGMYSSGVRSIDALRMLGSPGFRALADRVAHTPVRDGGWEASPLDAAPELVREVGAARDLSEDASVLYLQTLALAAPTTKDVQRWNGWTSARYKKAVTELAKRELVVEAKRARAGRAHFLPGPWEALKAPHLPIETWKLALYDVTRDANGALAIPLGRILPLRPLHEIFAAAWERVKTGDVPRYEEVE